MTLLVGKNLFQWKMLDEGSGTEYNEYEGNKERMLKEDR
jgi:hypothetical protein